MAGPKRYNRNHRDSNEAPLVKLAQRLGAQWCEEGPLDGWVWWRNVWLPVEIKLPEREGLANEYTPRQKRFFTRCRTMGARWLTWRTEDDVLNDLSGKRVA